MFSYYPVKSVSLEPPSDKQKAYAGAIAEALEISLPSEYSAKSYREFISKNYDEYREYVDMMTDISDEWIWMDIVYND